MQFPLIGQSPLDNCRPDNCPSDNSLWTIPSYTYSCDILGLFENLVEFPCHKIVNVI